MAVHFDVSRKSAIALTIAGSDSGGGAGIQTDLKTFATLGVHGTCAITCLTAQNPVQVRGIEACTASMVSLQIEAVFAELHPGAVKTGMLYSKPIIEAVAESLRSKRGQPLVVDPVMVATSGAPLLKPSAGKTLVRELLPLATLITPNLQETEALLSRTLKTVEDLRAAARQLHERFGCAALVKGGHLRGLRQAVDVLNDGRSEWLLTAPFIRGRPSHGTGCTYSAAITAYLARGVPLPKAVAKAKEFITRAIANSLRVGKHWVLNTTS